MAMAQPQGGQYYANQPDDESDGMEYQVRDIAAHLFQTWLELGMLCRQYQQDILEDEDDNKKKTVMDTHANAFFACLANLWQEMKIYVDADDDKKIDDKIVTEFNKYERYANEPVLFFTEGNDQEMFKMRSAIGKVLHGFSVIEIKKIR
jgi:hypothetical protein